MLEASAEPKLMPHAISPCNNSLILHFLDVLMSLISELLTFASTENGLTKVMMATWKSQAGIIKDEWKILVTQILELVTPRPGRG